MSTIIKGTYRDGKVELQELPQDVEDETPVIVTFPSPNGIDLQAHGITEAEAADLQAALATFEDWKLPEMAIYDDYDAAKPNYRRGDVALVLFPHSNLRAAKTRPALVVQANGLSSGLLQVIVAMITSQTSRAGHPSRVPISTASAVGKQSGLLTDSVVMTDNLATIADSAVYRVIGSFPMTQVDVALRHTLGL